MEKMVLIDGNSLFNRAFYATPIFSTSYGAPTNAVFGFTKLLFKILEDVKPDYIVVAFDMKAPTFRHKMYEGYKATRKPMPEELAVQVEPLKNLLSAMKIATCGIEGIEADDILGTLSRKFPVHSYIYTGDRDSYQLVDDNTDVCYTKRGVSDILHLTKQNFKEQVGILPDQIIDLKALMGDKSDNIPGISGIGDKIAADLLNKYGSLDGIYNNLDKIKPNIGKKLSESRDMAYLSYKLATIDRDCAIDLRLEDCAAPSKFGSDVRKIFEEFEFKSFLGLDIFEDNLQPAETNVNYPDRIILSSYKEIEPSLKSNREISVVLNDSSCEIYVGGIEFYAAMPMNLQDTAVSYDDYIEILKSVFCKAENRVLIYDYKAACYILNEFAIVPNCKYDDLQIAKYLCDSSAMGFGLKELCAYYLYDYGYCAYAMRRIFENYIGILKSDGTMRLYEEIEKPLSAILYSMERTGVLVSFERLGELTSAFQLRVEEYKKRIYAGCGAEFNINSPAQLAEVLYTNLGLTEVKKKKTGKYSTSAEVLEKLVDKAPVVGDILKFRLYQKLLSTYCDGLLPLIDKKTGLVHTTYNQTATATGRLSSSNPNLQNIPIREEEGRELRKIFVPHEGCVFIDADYSQIELRLLAHFSGCNELINAYNNGEDIHAITASQVFGVPLNEVTPKMRREAKAVNFGIIYGISDFGLSKNLNISVGTAKEYISKYFATYSAVKDYMNKNVEFAREHGYVSTLTGRKRVIPEIKSANYNLRQFGERAAMNMPLQGSSADIIKIAMINVYNALKRERLKSKMILQVHDELVLEAPENEVEVASRILKYEMEHAVELSVPLTVELHTGKNWYDAK